MLRALRNVAVAAVLAAVPAAAAAQPRTFGPSSSGSDIGTVPGHPVGAFAFFSQPGDYVEQTFTGVLDPVLGTPLAVADYAWFELTHYSRRAATTPYTFDLFVNGDRVGAVNFMALVSDPLYPYAIYNPFRGVEFDAPVAAVGGAYTVRLVQTSPAVPSDQGDVFGFVVDDQGGLSVELGTVPEPTTVVLFGTGALLVGVISRRRIRRA